MKVKLNVELELPDYCKTWSDAEIQQLLFDEYVNHATCAHLEDATHWCCKARVGTEDEDPTGRQIFEMHKNWGEICSNATWDWERVEN
jgi:hypothetical protein